MHLELNRPAIIDETIDGEVVAVDMEHGSYYSIRGSGVIIWHALARPTTAADVTSGMMRSGLAPADAASGIEQFIDELRQHGLIREAERPSEEAPDLEQAASLASTAPGAPFEAPTVEKFTDMEDLLLLDPIHDVDARGWPHPAAAE